MATGLVGSPMFGGLKPTERAKVARRPERPWVNARRLDIESSTYAPFYHTTRDLRGHCLHSCTIGDQSRDNTRQNRR